MSKKVNLNLGFYATFFCKEVPGVFSDQSTRTNSLYCMILQQWHTEKTWVVQNSLITLSPNSRSNFPTWSHPRHWFRAVTSSVLLACVHTAAFTCTKNKISLNPLAHICVPLLHHLSYLIDCASSKITIIGGPDHFWCPISAPHVF